MATEKNFENRVKNYLKGSGCWFVKYWAGGGFTRSGVPDLLICINGYFVGVEVKAPKGKASPLQIHCLREITGSGAVGAVIYPQDFEDFKEFISRVQAGERPRDLIQNYKFLTRWENQT